MTEKERDVVLIQLTKREVAILIIQQTVAVALINLVSPPVDREDMEDGAAVKELFTQMRLSSSQEELNGIVERMCKVFTGPGLADHEDGVEYQHLLDYLSATAEST